MFMSIPELFFFFYKYVKEPYEMSMALGARP